MGEVAVPHGRSRSDARSSRRRHLPFFCLASLLGYLLGIGVLAAALSRGEARVTLDGGATVWVLVGSMLGLAGGLVSAGAYREWRRRFH